MAYVSSGINTYVVRLCVYNLDKTVTDMERYVRAYSAEDVRVQLAVERPQILGQEIEILSISPAEYLSAEDEARAIYERFVELHGFMLGGSWNNLQPSVQKALPLLIRIIRNT